MFWDFSRLFSGWVVASQREAGGVTVFFFFCGLLPVVAFLACCLRRKWGAWILVVSPWVASLGLLGIQGSMGVRLLSILLFVVPTSLLGLMFQRLLGDGGVSVTPPLND